LVIAGLVASSFFEPVATRWTASSPESTYLIDFMALWAVFVITFVVLRAGTEILSPYRLKFDPWTEMIGRSIMSVTIAVTFFAFASFTLHTAPLPVDGMWGDHFQPTPQANSFGIGADRAWMRFVRSASTGSLSEFRESSMLPPYQLNSTTSVREFDPSDEYVTRYRHRRLLLSRENAVQVNREN
jgi:hypothetical protein